MTRTLYCVKVHVVFLYSFISFTILASRLACASLKVEQTAFSRRNRSEQHRIESSSALCDVVCAKLR